MPVCAQVRSGNASVPRSSAVSLRSNSRLRGPLTCITVYADVTSVSRARTGCVSAACARAQRAATRAAASAGTNSRAWSGVRQHRRPFLVETGGDKCVTVPVTGAGSDSRRAMAERASLPRTSSLAAGLTSANPTPLRTVRNSSSIPAYPSGRCQPSSSPMRAPAATWAACSAERRVTAGSVIACRPRSAAALPRGRRTPRAPCRPAPGCRRYGCASPFRRGRLRPEPRPSRCSVRQPG